MNDETIDAKKVIGAANMIVKMASDSPEMRQAGQTFAKTSLTIAKAVDNILLPIAAVNFAFDKARAYFQSQFKHDLEAATEPIPKDELVEPKASVAAPALQGLAFSHEEPDLKSMYICLLRTAMDGRRSETAHPAYAEIVRQLSGVEAHYFSEFAQGPERIPIVTLEGKVEEGLRPAYKNLVNWQSKEIGGPRPFPDAPRMFDNWVRLGLTSISYDFQLAAAGVYDWVESRPEYADVDKSFPAVHVTKGIFELSAFGKAFYEAVST